MGQSAATTTSPAWLGLASFASLGVILALAIPSTFRVFEIDASNATTNAPAPTAADDTNDGTDATRPVLAPSDQGFVDKRGGWGWGDRCWLNLKAQKWGYAKAECDQAMTLNPKSPLPLASLLYNQALITIHAGDTEAAKRLLEQSLQLREHPDVRAAYRNLP